MSLISILASFIKRKTSKKYRFNLQFEQKKWDSMRNVADRGRYEFLVGYTRRNYPNARILDLGCGEGILLEQFEPRDYGAYLGVDFSEVAIANAKKLENSKVKFMVGDLDSLSIEGSFDVIIYNETLYYLRNPKGAVQSVFKHLAPGGVIIISMVDKHGKERAGLWGKMG